MADTDGMNLDDYVRETLLALVRGVVNAQADELAGGYIGRSPIKEAPHLNLAKDGDGNIITTVKFDLATTVEAKTERGGGFGIKVVPMFTADATAKAASTSSMVSRLAFEVPISIPKPIKQMLDDKARSDRIDGDYSRAIARSQSGNPVQS
ncbi:MAG: hypothetical protein P4L64_11190 [Caulobacteraceae bacterium]|nr:hypothetical protein [Caulobacteraceae bacterium]